MPPSLTGARVVVVSSEQPGARMAGPAIRALNLAEQLAAAGAVVMVAVPEEPDIDLGVTTRAFGKPGFNSFRALARESDVVITQPQRVDVARGLHSGRARVIYDLYVPSFVEYPASLAADDLNERTRAKLVERNHREYATAVACGDGFLVASERQKDFVLGALGQAGRLRHPPDPRSEAFPRVVTVPFGLPSQQPPPPAEHVIKGRLVPDDSIVALWAGGVWNWFDPVTVVRGLAAARRTEPRLRLVFLGAGHPSPAFQGQTASAQALASAEVQHQVDQGAVVFADEWVPYRERWSYLADSDLAVCAHFDSPETRMSFRTRFLDHLWAGLPTVCTAGGVLSDVLSAAGAARTVPAHDEAAWAQALSQLAGDAATRAQMGQAAHELAADYTWERVSRPAVALVADLVAGRVGPRERPGWGDTAAYLAVAVENRLRS